VAFIYTSINRHVAACSSAAFKRPQSFMPRTRQHLSLPATWLPDLMAGLSVAGLLLPEAVAYSSIAGLPAQAGVLALLAGLVCYGLTGTSRFAIVSATSSAAAVLAAATATLANGNAALRLELTAGLVLLTGLLFVVAALARLGNITQFIAKPVLRGVTFGLAIVIVLKQLPKIVDVQPQHQAIPLYAFELVQRLPEWHLPALLTGACAVLLLFALGRVRRLPAALLVIALGIVAGQVLALQRYGIPLVGAIHLELGLPGIPSLDLPHWLRLGELAVAVLLILYAESYSSIRYFALKHGDSVAPNRDMLALGLANLLSGLLHGMPVGAGYSATSANEAAGAQSRLAGWVAVLAVLLVVLTLMPAIALTPEPVLAAVVIHAVSHTLRLEAFRPYFKWRRDQVIVVGAVLGVLLLGVLDGLLLAMAVSLALTLRRFSEPNISVLGRLGHGHDFVDLAAHPDARPVPGMLIVRPEAPLFFANAEQMLAAARRHVADAGSRVQTVILSLEESPDLDSSSIEALDDFATHLAKQGKQLLLARVKEPVLAVLDSAALASLPATAMTFLSVDDAVTACSAGCPAPATGPDAALFDQAHGAAAPDRR
jgi:MFS superfamily sulfate permease-like transporter